MRDLLIVVVRERSDNVDSAKLIVVVREQSGNVDLCNVNRLGRVPGLLHG